MTFPLKDGGLELFFGGRNAAAQVTRNVLNVLHLLLIVA